MVFGDLNIWALVGAVLANLIIGKIWYSSFAFGKLWMRASGVSAEELQKACKKTPFLSALFGACLMTLVMTYFVFMLGMVTVSQGIQFAALVWLGFRVSPALPDFLYCKRPWSLFLIQMGHSLIVMAVMASILAVWQ